MAVVWALVAACASLLIVFLWNDLAEYRQFKTLDDTVERQRHFRKWIVKGALFFGGSTVIGLLILGRLDLLDGRVPAEFGPLSAALPALVLKPYHDAFAIGAAAGLIGAVIASFVVSRLNRRKIVKKVPVLGDIDAILPRNGAERAWAALIALNAGWSEELFFRLLLPLLLTLVSGSAVIGFGVAVAVFGIVHLYQGIAGILATTLLGALFAFLFLATGNLWIAAAVHALIDLNGLLLRPLLTGQK